MKSERGYVYGLFEGEKCRYVGSTIDPKARKKMHVARGALRDHPHLEFRILSKSHNVNNAERKEMRLIRKLKKCGAADLNKRWRRNCQLYDRKISNASWIIFWREKGITFTGMSQVARYFGCSQAAVANAFRCYSGELLAGAATLTRLPAADPLLAAGKPLKNKTK